MAPPRSYGLPYHILYLVVSLILIAIPAFSTAASVYWLSANTSTLQLRFGSRDYCGYNATAVQGVALDSALGCIYAGWSYTVIPAQLGLYLPGAITQSLSRGAALTPFCFAFLAIAVAFQAYATRYSYMVDPAPHKDKVYTLVQLVFIVNIACSIFLWVTFFVLVCIVASATNDKTLNLNGVAIWWGASVWLVLAASIAQIGAVYEAVRWRFVENSRT